MRAILRTIGTAVFFLAGIVFAIAWLSVWAFLLLRPELGDAGAALVLAFGFVIVLLALLSFAWMRRRRAKATSDPLLYLLGALVEVRETDAVNSPAKSAEAVLAELLADFVRHSETGR